MNNGAVKSYSLEDESYERLVAILKRKDNHKEDLGEKMTAMENGIKSLVEEMENLRRTLENIATKMECN